MNRSQGIFFGGTGILPVGRPARPGDHAAAVRGQARCLSRHVALLAVAAGLLLVFGSTTGCDSNPPPVASKFDASMADLNQGYGLLYSLVGKNQQVDEILAIKSVSPATQAIIKDIASLCKKTKTQLDEFAKADDTLGMADQGLPRFELETRDAIETTTTKRLLFSNGDLFEMRLLQTQAESMNYMAHLALSISVNDDNPDRKAALKQISDQADAYYQQVTARLTIVKADDAQTTRPADE